MVAGSKMARPAASPLKGESRALKAEPKSPAAPKAPAKAASGCEPIPKDAAKRMSYHLKQHPDLQKQYQLCKGHQERIKFFYDIYLLDTSVSEKAVLKRTQRIPMTSKMW